MLYSEIIAVCSHIHTKHINTLCGQNVELMNTKPGGYSLDVPVFDLQQGQEILFQAKRPDLF
jgi:hypothetical protein